MAILKMELKDVLSRATDYVTALERCVTKVGMKTTNIVYTDCHSTALGLRAVALVVKTNQARCDAITAEVPKKRLKKLKLLNDFMVEGGCISDSKAYQKLAKVSKIYHADLADYKTADAFMPLYNKAMAGNAVALKVLAQLYLGKDFLGTENDYASAILCFEQAAALLGDWPLYIHFAFYFLTAEDVSKRAIEVEAYLLAKVKDDNTKPNHWLYLTCLYHAFPAFKKNARKCFNAYMIALMGNQDYTDAASQSVVWMGDFFADDKDAELYKTVEEYTQNYRAHHQIEPTIDVVN